MATTVSQETITDITAQRDAALVAVASERATAAQATERADAAQRRADDFTAVLNGLTA